MRFSDFSVLSVNSVVKQIAGFTTEDTEFTEELATNQEPRTLNHDR